MLLIIILSITAFLIIKLRNWFDYLFFKRETKNYDEKTKTIKKDLEESKKTATRIKDKIDKIEDEIKNEKDNIDNMDDDAISEFYNSRYE